MLRKAFGRTVLVTTPRRFAGGAGAHPQKLGDKTHLETAIVTGGQFLNTGNLMLGAFCKKHNKEPVAIFADKTRPIQHEFSKDLHAHDSFKNEMATGKGIFTAPKKGHFYKIESDVQEFDPANKKLIMQDKVFTYDHLILASEFFFDFSKVANMEAAFQDYWNSHVVTTAQIKAASTINRANREFRYDNFLVTLPKSPYKNEGTNHICYWFDELKNDRSIAAQWYDSKFIVTSPDAFLHRVPHVNDLVIDLMHRRGIEVRFHLQLKAIRFNNILDHHRIAEAEFVNTQTGKTEVISYGMLAAYPEASVPANLKPFLDSTGLIDVDPHTLQHRKYPDVFALGECTNLPTINNAVAACAQAQVVAGNVGEMKHNKALKYAYNGASATPIFTGRKKMIMPGFNYAFEPVSTKLTSDTTSPLAGLKQSLSFTLFKRYEKKFFEKKAQGKIYGPPSWTKPSNSQSSKPAPAASK